MIIENMINELRKLFNGKIIFNQRIFVPTHCVFDNNFDKYYFIIISNKDTIYLNINTYTFIR